MNSFINFVCFLLVVFFSYTTFSQNKPHSGNDVVVAQVGPKKITLSEFHQKYDEVKTQTINAPTKTQFLEDLIRFEVGVQEAEKLKLQEDPVVKERIKQEIYKVLIEKAIGTKIQAIKVDEADMKEFYKKNPELRTSHILIEFKPDANPEQKTAAKKRAEEIFDEVRKSKRPFEELVKLYSDDPISKQVGGDVGWQSRVTLVPSYYETAYKMQVGEVKGLVETQFGYHIIKLTGKRSYENASKRQLRMAVFDEKRRVIFNDYFDKLKKTFSISVNAKAIQ